MSRLLWILLFLGSFFSAGVTAYAEEANPTVDWTQDEQLMHDVLKEAQPRKTEAEIQEAMGYVLLNKSNQWEKAADHYKQAVQLNPKLFKAWYSLGLIFMCSEEGDGYLIRSTDANPDFAPSWYWLGYNACRAGKDTESIDYFKKFLQVARNDEQEAGRVKVATAVLAELHSGKPGPETAKIRPS